MAMPSYPPNKFFVCSNENLKTVDINSLNKKDLVQYVLACEYKKAHFTYINNKCRFDGLLFSVMAERTQNKFDESFANIKRNLEKSDKGKNHV